MAKETFKSACEIAEYINAKMQKADGVCENIPEASVVTVLPPVPSERFAVKLTFANGEMKKYVLPIEEKSEHEETVEFQQYVFSDEIWNTAELADEWKESEKMVLQNIRVKGAVLRFQNGYFLPAMLCYLEGTDYFEPAECEEVVFENDSFSLCKKWSWLGDIYEDVENGLFRIFRFSLSEQGAFRAGKSTFAFPEGKRVTSLEFDYTDSFFEGLAKVYSSGHGYGFVDKEMRLVVPMKYSKAEEFVSGMAKVERDGTECFVDKTGREIEVNPFGKERYQEIEYYSEGLCEVSVFNPRKVGLAYYSDHGEGAGVWGYINTDGEEVIKPQYIFASSFEKGMAIVCKGKWTIDEKWDYNGRQGKYWTEEELWGAIDATGKEVIPFVFDDIDVFWSSEEPDIFKAHYGGWENGHWGVIDRHGNWVVEPIFNGIEHGYKNGLIVFCEKGDLEPPLGIYDLKQKKVIFEPQFEDVEFEEDGNFRVTIVDKETGKAVERIIDVNGKEKVPSAYSTIFADELPYIASIKDVDGNVYGVLDGNGIVIFSNNDKAEVRWGGEISYANERIVVKRDRKEGLMDFNRNIVVAPKYNWIYEIDKPLLIVRVGERDNYKEGLITPDGVEVLPAIYTRIHWCNDNRIICFKKETYESTVYQVVMKVRSFEE